MGNNHKTEIAVLDANEKHDKLPKDFALAVKDIKLAILQARANAARLANAEALKLSNQLQVELPGLRGFSAANIKYMRIFFDEWARWFEIRHLPSDENRQTASDGDALMPIRHLPSDELTEGQITAFLSIGFTHHREILNKCATYDERWYYITACAKGPWTVEQLHSHLEIQLLSVA